LLAEQIVRFSVNGTQCLQSNKKFVHSQRFFLYQNKGLRKFSWLKKLQGLFSWRQTEQFVRQQTTEHFHVFRMDISNDVRLIEQFVRFVEPICKPVKFFKKQLYYTVLKSNISSTHYYIFNREKKLEFIQRQKTLNIPAWHTFGYLRYPKIHTTKNLTNNSRKQKTKNNQTII
jgi:hypothetical protein